jgi:FkbM family methyltransferase
MNMLKKIMISWYNFSEGILSKRSLEFRRKRLIKAYRRRLSNFVISRYRSTYLEIDGRKMFLGPTDSLKLSFKRYDDFLEDFVKSRIKKDDTIIDLGANIGFFSLLFAQQIENKGKVYAFEPEPTLFELLKKNVDINNFENIEVIQKAVSNKTENTKLFLSHNPNDHRIYDPHDDRKYVNIESTRLDDFFQDSDVEINFIKSNIQGADFAAILGMPKIIKKSKNLEIIAEFSSPLLEGFGFSPREFLITLQNFGFKIYDLDSLEKKITPIEIEIFLEKYSPEKDTGTTIFCTKNSL